MQFTGHPLPVHPFVTAPCNFNAYAISSHNWPTESATSAVFGMACLARSEANIQHKATFMQFDIIDFYPSITKNTLIDNINYARK